MGRNTNDTVLIAGSGGADSQLIREMLRGRFLVEIIADDDGVLQRLRQAPRCALVVLDVAGCATDGWALLHELRASFLTADIPVLALVEPEAAERALAVGATDVLEWPLQGAVLRPRIAAQIELHRLRILQQQPQHQLEYQVARRVRESAQIRDAAILAMACLAESGEANVGIHLQRTRMLFTALARELRFHPRFAGQLSDTAIDLMAQAAPLHDIGMVGVPDAILKKPGRLTPEEFAIMKRHTLYGRDAIVAVERVLGTGIAFLRYAREITYSHQEKWDGSGYPQGLQGEEIPLSARLMAVADVYDALISHRVYKPAFTHETAIELIRQERGGQFDPDIVDALLHIEDRFRMIAAQFGGPAAAAEDADTACAAPRT